MSEADLVRDIRLRLSIGDVRLLRNNVGALQDARGHWITYGLGVGTSDLIGWQSRIIRAADIGSRLAVFTAFEAKSEHGRLTEEQSAFIGTVLTAGGIAGVVRSVDEAYKLLGY
jgi:hypothetical protein